MIHYAIFKSCKISKISMLFFFLLNCINVAGSLSSRNWPAVNIATLKAIFRSVQGFSQYKSLLYVLKSSSTDELHLRSMQSFIFYLTVYIQLMTSLQVLIFIYLHVTVRAFYFYSDYNKVWSRRRCINNFMRRADNYKHL